MSACRGVKDLPMPTISVVIATYNRCASLENTINFLLYQKQDGAFDYEVLVIDNNSKDGTKKTVEDFIPQFGGRLRYLFEPNQAKVRKE